MIEDYQIARKNGENAVKAALKKGLDPYLPVLDSITEGKKQIESYVGLISLPLDYIAGNKEMSRNNAFANNFMPLLGDGTEFAGKWAALFDSCMEEGIHDAIKVYEYMNKYYVQEGNKRVSVAKYLKIDFILADVTRILPPMDDSKEVKAYYEYLKFYEVTKCIDVTFSEPGAYAKLAELMGQDLENKWSEDAVADLKMAFFVFAKLYRAIVKNNDRQTLSDAFLVYLSVFPVKSIFEDSEDQIAKNIKMAKLELISGSRLDEIEFLADTPVAEERKATGIMGFFSRGKNYTEASPLKVGFVYDEDAETSRWVDSHEAGRLYAEAIIGSRVSTSCYLINHGNNGEEILNKAVNENEVIFTVSSKLITETVQLALANPTKKLLNCSVGQPHPSIRCYQGKLYEACFLTGMLAAEELLLTSPGNETRRIGYLLDIVRNTTVANLNAFAIGASLIDPQCRISLKMMEGGNHKECVEKWREEGIRLYADFGHFGADGTKGKPGVYRMTEGNDEFVATPFVGWGKFYSQIIQSVLSGAWDFDQGKATAATNYWFGLSTGVVNVVAPNLPYQTAKLLSFMKNSIINGELDPFSGELHSRDGLVQGGNSKSNILVREMEKMTTAKIIEMNWLNENIDGELPV